MDSNEENLNTSAADRNNVVQVCSCLPEPIRKIIFNALEAEGLLVALLDGEGRLSGTPACLSEHRAEADLRPDLAAGLENLARQVCGSGQAVAIADYQQISPGARRQDGLPRNLLAVPLPVETGISGILAAINKRIGEFTQSDMDWLDAAACLVGLRIENMHLRAALGARDGRIQKLTGTMGAMIHQLSHELKTPLAVSIASVKLLQKRLDPDRRQQWTGLHDRIERNLQRLLSRAYEIEDGLRRCGALDEEAGGVPQTSEKADG